MALKTKITKTDDDFNRNYVNDTFFLRVELEDSENDFYIQFLKGNESEMYRVFNIIKLAIEFANDYNDYFELECWKRELQYMWPEGKLATHVDIVYYDNEGHCYELDDMEYLCGG